MTVTPDAHRPVFLFAGQGAQWPGMGVELLDSSPLFADRMHACELALSPYVDWSLTEVLRDPLGRWLKRVDMVEPALFAVTVSLAALWQRSGVEPVAVAGHSQGEIAAAYVAGGLSLEDAARIVALRGKALVRIAGQGAMWSVSLSTSEVRARLESFPGTASLAARNGPSSQVVSGDDEPLERLMVEWGLDRVRVQRIAIDYAAHSPHVDALRDELLDGAAGILPRTGELPFYSTVTGELLDTAELDPEYWYRNLRQTVLLEPVVRRLLEQGQRAFVEISPHPVLTFGVRETIGSTAEHRDAVVSATLRRHDSGMGRFTRSVAEIDGETNAVDVHAVEAGPGESRLAERLASAPRSEWTRLAAELVRSEVAAVLGHRSAGEVPLDAAFRDLGLDSLAAVELRNRLRGMTGLSLTTAAIYNHPTSIDLGAHLLVAAEGGERRGAVAVRGRTDEPIAIVGMACRYPGGIASPEDLWELVSAGRDAIGGFPDDRGWDLERLYDADPDHGGTSYVREGGFLADAADFDAGFFGIGPREADAMDPQQRLFLETSWEALERAGVDPDTLRGSETGVFAGVSGRDYAGAYARPDLEGLRLTGCSAGVISGRVAYSLGLEGPALTIDTACSASLVALHVACQALRAGECELALAGGVTVLATPDMFVEFSRQRGLARDGRCKAFADGADGTGWSEGVGVLLVERLSDARRNGHRVLALVRGSAINQDGASNGLTAPSGSSQQRAIGRALASAGLAAGDVDAVEGHGTGTALGDPIEVEALLATFGAARDADEPLWLGSIKSNIGHTQAAAGVAGVIKMAMAMRHGRLPKTLHVESPSSEVDWSAGTVELLTDTVDWPQAERPRRAGVSSFGISGTNAHVILEQAETVEPAQLPAEADMPAVALGAMPWIVSARDDAALREQARLLVAHVERDDQLSDVAVAATLAAGRARLARRAIAVGAGREELIAGLRAFARGGSPAGVVEGVAGDGRTAFLFTGQGAQRRGMGSGLHRALPAFADSFDATCALLDRHFDRPLGELVLGAPDDPDAALLDQTAYTQACMFALEVALYRALESLGVAPDFLIGHSVGEIAAAHLAGVMDLEAACELVARRGWLMQRLPAGGAMAAIRATEEELRDILAELDGRVVVAGVNGPRAVVVSGDEDLVLESIERAHAAGLEATRLRVSHAFHSPRVDPMLDEFRAVVGRLALSAPRIPIVSNVTGGLLSDDDATSPDYWARHVREPVRFMDGIRTLEAAGVTRYLELGPDGVLATLAEDSLTKDAVLAPLLSRDRPEGEAFVAALALAHCDGLEVDWGGLVGGPAQGLVDLPTYAFQRQRHWIDAPALGGTDVTAAGVEAANHPLLGAAIPLSDGDGRLLTGRLSLHLHPWLADHSVLGAVLLPGTAFVELALRAGGEVGCRLLRELTLETPLVVPEREAVQLQLWIGDPDADGGRRLSLRSRPEGADDQPWTLHATALLEPDPPSPEGFEQLASWPPDGATAVEVDDVYDRLADNGLDYGPAFQGLRAAWQRGDELFAELALPDDRRPEGGAYGLHPALADAALHALILLGGEFEAEARLPFSWGDVALHTPGAADLRVQISRRGDGAVALRAAADDGTPVATIGELTTRPAPDDALVGARQAVQRRSLYRIDWAPCQAPTEEAPERWATVGGGPEIAAALREAGAQADPYPDLTALIAALGDGLPPPDAVLLRCAGGTGADLPGAAAQITGAVLAELQRWLADDRFADLPLAVVTEGAVAAADRDRDRDGEIVGDLAAAPVWGLVRTVQSEQPGRLALIDLDGDAASRAAVATALATGEPQLAIRSGELLVPRMARVDAAAGHERVALGEAPGTVLVTGGTGGLGRLVARHLVADHGVAHVVLASRSGGAAAGASELEAELTALGARVTLAACDVSQRDDLAALIDAIPEDLPLTAVVHAAGTLDDGIVESMTAQRLEAVLAPKADAAWHLHELTRDRDLRAFVLFSSVAATFGSAGQSNYAAANAFLDALAAQRRAAGLPATSIAWGLWDEEHGMGGRLDEAELRDMARGGVLGLTPAEGLALFDAALAGDSALTLAARLDHAALRAQADDGTLAQPLRGLVRGGAARRPERSGGSLEQRLAALPESERADAALELVLAEAAAVLGHETTSAVDPARAFKEQGFDSLMAVRLRTRLNRASSSRLSSTVVFDHPTPLSLAGHLLERAAGGGGTEAPVDRAHSPRPAGDRASDDRQYDREPVAIVGMACRYPGGVASPEQLWELVAGGRDAVSEFPTDRGWPLARIYDPDPDRPGTSYTREGAFLHDAADFDAGFFGVTPREALAMDPQQRLLLETAWETLEDAGIVPEALRGSEVGVFTGVMYHEYGSELWASGEGTGLEGYASTGNAGSVVSGRLAYSFGLQGPAVSVDTACSSSLVALHLACQALRADECELALAGGVTVMSSPRTFVEFSRQRGLAPDGRCKPFAAAADGVGWGEGAGLLALERLSDARRNGRPVLAVIRGSAVNQDGASNGLAAPSGVAQQRVIRAALANAGLDPGDVDVVEAHGTGTTLGDPIEAEALLATYGRGRADRGPLRFGSIKSNIGHAQAAAGVAGVIKMALAMREGLLPKTLHVDRPSPKVDWSAGGAELLTETGPWEADGRPRRAGVSSFGISGTNAHVILEEAPPEHAEHGAEAVTEPPEPGVELLPGRILLPLSAKSDSALNEQAARLAARLHDDPALDPIDVGYSLGTERAAFDQRAVVLGADRDELLSGLADLASGRRSGASVRGVARAGRKPVFLFAGQGAQWRQMGVGLLDSSPAFAGHVRACEEALSPFVDWSLAEVLRDRDGAWLDRLDIVQPALFGVMVSLARLWRDCGVEPVAVVGHSQGEIAAACVAGGLSLEDAARLVALRGKTMAKIAGKGGMASVALPVDELLAHIEPFADRVSLAAMNGPASQVISGDPAAVDTLLAGWASDGVRSQRIAVDYAAHSPQIDALRDELMDAFAGISPRSEEVPFHSTVSGGPLDTAELDARYWYRNLRAPVCFEPVLRSLLERGQRGFLEMSPHPVLAFGVRETAESVAAHDDVAVLGSLRRGGGSDSFARAVAEAHSVGIEIDWAAFYRATDAKRVKLPTYPFQRERFWLQPGSAASRDVEAAGLEATGHPLLGASLELPDRQGWVFTGRLALATHPWLADHAVGGDVLLAGAAFLELAIHAARHAGLDGVDELVMQTPLTIPASGAVELQVTVSQPDGQPSISIHSRQADAGRWALHATGSLTRGTAPAPPALEGWPSKAAEPIAIDGLYDRLADSGYDYGLAFQCLVAAWRDGDDTYAEVSLGPDQRRHAHRYGIHPALLDGALHATLLSDDPGARRPFAWNDVVLHAPGASASRVKVSRRAEDAVSLTVYDTDGTVVAEIGSLRTRPLDVAGPSAYRRDPLFTLEWVELPAPSPNGAPPARDVVVAELASAQSGGDDDTSVDTIQLTTHRGLAMLQGWLADERLTDTRFALVTKGAVAVDESESPNLSAAPLAGLLRSARSEHPGRFVHVDSDGAKASLDALPAALEIDEPQLALREGAVLVPRVAPVPAPDEMPPIDPDATVLITGGTGGLGALVARHLVGRHGARQLLLASRRGPEAGGAAELRAELEQLGAEVAIVSCDVSDRDQVAAMLAAIPLQHPLDTVIHAAGALDDGPIDSIEQDRFRRVFAPKVDGAWHLHELTKRLDVARFVMFSSTAGVFGSPGRANYAAANSFLDALAQRRRVEGLAATSIVWGLWQRESEMASQLSEADRAMTRRSGVEELSDEQGLALFDAALGAEPPLLLALRLDQAALRARAGALPTVLSNLVRPTVRSERARPLAAELAGLDPRERKDAVLELVRREAAEVLGLPAADALPGDKTFMDLGFDSLAVLELRERLSVATGLRLEASVGFDYPSAAELAQHLVEVAAVPEPSLA